MPTSAKTCGSCGAQGQIGAFCDECGETLPQTANAPETATAGAAPSPSASHSASLSVSPSVSPAVSPESESSSGSMASSEPVPSSGAAPSFTPAPVPTTPSPEQETRLDAFQPIPPVPPVPPAADNKVGLVGEAGRVGATGKSGEAGKPGEAEAGDSDSRARDMLLRVSQPSKPENVAPPVLPDRPKPVVPVEWNKHQAETEAGGTPCPWCATLNPVGRHFCRRCAMSMERAPGETGPVRLPWWRRMLDRNNRPIPYAGQRPRLRRGPGQLARLLITLAIVILLIVMAAIFGGKAVEAIQDHFATPQPLSVARVTASNTSPLDPPPTVLTDPFNDTWWGTGDTKAGAWADVRFPKPYDLLDVIVTPGAGVQPQDFASQDNPKSLTLTMTSTDGTKTTQVLSLPGTAGAKPFSVHAKNVQTIRIEVGGANPGSGKDPEIAIAGIEFFGK